VVLGHKDIGERLVDDPRLPLISATGSVAMGREVGPRVAKRFGRALLELGGNNAIIVTPSADLDIALPSILFGSVGTAGQRCTSTRRVIVHESIHNQVFDLLANAATSLKEKVGDPREEGTLIGPLIDKQSFENLQAMIERVRPCTESLVGGERLLQDRYPDAYYVAPAIAKLPEQDENVHVETFAPLTYVVPYKTLDDALRIHNAVPQGLSSAIMTTDVREAEFFKANSDCGIANVNIGTSGAEIGGAFGGEKETGGGRESGSDSWKAYMRRQTSTTYFGTEKPALAQGVRFEV
jgi:aldehyde dehydrogenase (NAD+)